MRGNAKRETLTPGETGEADRIRRLIELQRQIVEQVDKNSEAERSCRALRQQLAREAEELFVRSRGLRARLHRAAAALFKRLYDLTRRRRARSQPGLTLLPDPVRQDESR